VTGVNPEPDTDIHEPDRLDGPFPGAAFDPRATTQPQWRRRPFLLVLAAVTVLALVVGAFVWRSSSAPAPDGPDAAGPGAVIMTKAQLLVVAGSAGHSLYWAGAQGLDSFEVTIASRDVYVRYLPAGVPVGTTDPHLTVGTYEKTGAHGTLVTWAAVPGAVSKQLAGGALVVQPAGKATSAYFAFSGHDLLIEVFDPTPGRAFSLIESGAIQPIA
jgi:hypothetical protein